MLQSRARLAARAVFVAALVASAGCGGDDAGDTASGTTSTTATAVTTPPSGPATTNTDGSAATGGPVPTAPNQAERLIEIVVRGGSVAGGGRHKVNLDEEVRLRITSDVADEVHIHGYERRFDLRPGETAEFGFAANLPGVFEVELEKAGKRLLDLEVQP